MTTIDFNRDYFSLFGLPAAFKLDETLLEGVYRDIQSQVHPDRHAHLPESQRRLSMQWATRVNEAYRTLRQPLSRAQYLLHLRGIDTHIESNTAMPAQFLMEQMEWREAVADARAEGDSTALEHLHQRLRQHRYDILADIERDLDQAHDDQAAAEAVRRLMFIEKLQREIDEALEALES